MNRLSKMVKNTTINFNAVGLGNFDYKMLMNNQKIQLDKMNEDIVRKYKELDLKKHFMVNKNDDSDKIGNTLFLYQDIKRQILEVNNNEQYVVDVLIKYLYDSKKSNYKTTLWESFGDIIVCNLKNNLTKKFKHEAIHCGKCGRLIENTTGNKLYCEECAKEIKKEKDRERMKNKRKIK